MCVCVCDACRAARVACCATRCVLCVSRACHLVCVARCARRVALDVICVVSRVTRVACGALRSARRDVLRSVAMRCVVARCVMLVAR